MAKLEITNMVMVQNCETGQVVVQERIKTWRGMAFPGGHAENGETIYDSAIREVKEETGLAIDNLEPCGFIYWYNNQTYDRYFTYFYKTTDYSGELLSETEEGKVFWATIDELKSMRLSPNFKEYLPMFLESKYAEAYCSWNNNTQPDLSKENPWGIIYR